MVLNIMYKFPRKKAGLLLSWYTRLTLAAFENFWRAAALYEIWYIRKNKVSLDFRETKVQCSYKCRFACVKFYLNRCRFPLVIAKCLGAWAAPEGTGEGAGGSCPLCVPCAFALRPGCLLSKRNFYGDKVPSGNHTLAKVWFIRPKRHFFLDADTHGSKCFQCYWKNVVDAAAE